MRIVKRNILKDETKLRPVKLSEKFREESVEE